MSPYTTNAKHTQAPSEAQVPVLRSNSPDDGLVNQQTPPADKTKTASVSDQLKSRRVYSKHHWHAHAVKDLHMALSQGAVTPSTIPNTYLESERIVSPLSPEGATFQRVMEQLTTRLVPGLDLKDHPITFVISDTGHENAYVVTTPKQSLICLDRAILETFDNLDQLSWVLLHELTHLQYRGIFGAIQNTQVEEGICDLRPLGAMMEAGLNPAEAEKYAIKMAAIKQPPWMSMVDVHGLPQYRVDSVQKGLVALRQSRGTLPTTTEALPHELHHDGPLKNAHHESFIDRALKEVTYEEKSTLDKIRNLSSLLSDLQTPFPHRAEEFAKHVKVLQVSEHDKEERKLLSKMMDSLLDNPPAFNVVHHRIRSVLDGPHQNKTRYYAPRIIALAKAAKAFIDAEEGTTQREKTEAAAHFINTLESLPSWQSINWGPVDLPHFELANEREYKIALRDFKRTGEEVVFPWHELAEAARPENQIARALLCLGTWDDRIPQNAGLKDLEWMNEHVSIGEAAKTAAAYSYDDGISRPRNEDRDVSRLQFRSNGAGIIMKFNALESSRLDAIDPIISGIRNALDRQRVAEQSVQALSSSVTGRGVASLADGTLSFQDLPFHKFMEDPYVHLRLNTDTLVPGRNASDPGRGGLLDAATRTSLVNAVVASRNLMSYFDRMLATDSEPEISHYRKFVRDFFLDHSTPFNYGTLDSQQLAIKGLTTATLPYLEWVAADKHKLFTIPERGAVCWDYHDEAVLRLARTATRVNKPTTVDELVTALDAYLLLRGDTNRREQNFEDLNLFADGAMSQEVNHYFRDHGAKGELHRLLSTHGDRLYRMDRDTEFDSSIAEYLSKEKSWPTDPVQLGYIYRAIDSLGAFPDEQWRINFVNRLMESIDATQDSDAKLAALENLLLDAPPKDVDIRDGAISRWVTCAASMFGSDDTLTWNTENCPYLARIEPLLERIGTKAHTSVRGPLLHAFANQIVAQRQVSHAIERAALGPIRESRVVEAGDGYGALQATFALVGTEKDARLRSFHFLTRPLTPKGLRAFAKETMRAATDGIKIFGQEDSGNINSKFFRRRVELECKRLHENFWKAPMPYRAAFLEDLLMPAEQRLDDLKAGKNDTFQQACDYVISEFLPLTDARRNPIKYAPEAQRILRAFLAPGVLDHRQQPVFLSALMASAQRSQTQGSPISVGQTLATIFDAMGPAWRKFGQAISSHPSTPIDIARDMEPLKGKLSMTRSEAWALYERTVPEEIRLQNPRLGKVLESASFFTAVDAGDDVFTFLTPYALNRAEDGFSIMEAFVAELRKADDAFAQIAPPVAEMVHSARTSAVLETNGRVGAAQTDAMRARYDDLTVTIGTQRFPFGTATWRHHGPEFRRMQKMKGPTFNDLPSTTPEEALHKRQVAKAILYVELRNILSGNAFCPDRHGRNIRVDGNSVGHFDHGAVHAVVRDKKGNEVNPLHSEEALVSGGTVEIPGANRTEKLQLAEALYSSFTQLSEGQPLAVVLHNEIEKARAATGETPDYLIRVERALLAMNDCFKCLDSKGQDIKDILGGLLLNGDIDPVITAALEKKIIGQKLGAFGMFVNASKTIRAKVEGMIAERITISQGRRAETLRSAWHDNPKNTQDIPTLLTTKDFRPTHQKTSPKPDERRLSLVPTLSS